MEQRLNTDQGWIAWFARNHVAANLLMLFIVVLGVLTYFGMQRQMFPQAEQNFVEIQVRFKGAAPQEIEEGILIKIEEALRDVEGVKRIRSSAWRGSGNVTVELFSGENVPERLDQIKLRVDAIATFPTAMEPLTISQRLSTQDAVELILTGTTDSLALKAMGRQIEKELLAVNNVTFVEFNSMPAWEIAIEISPAILEKYQLSLTDVQRQIQAHSDNLSAGVIRTDAGQISIRSEQRAYRAADFASIPIITGAQGEQVFLKDIATIQDGFEERTNYMRSNGKHAAFISVKATNQQSLPDVAAAVQQFVKRKNTELPAGYQLEVLVDMTYYLNGRLSMMWSNMLQGAALVLLLLMIFLRFRVALWVMLGLPLAFLGAIALMPLAGVTINIVTLFAFIMVLGIVVDDAIVIGESAYQETETYGHSIDNVIRGAKRVATPATFGVLTTMAVFAPFMFDQSAENNEFRNISIVVVLCLFFSLIESKFILPAHLAHTRLQPLPEGNWRYRFNQRFAKWVTQSYQPLLQRCLNHRYTMAALFIGLLLSSIALLQAGHLRFIFTPAVPHDYPSIRFEMHQNASEQQTLAVLQALETMVYQQEEQLRQEQLPPMVKNVFAFLQGQHRGELLMTLVDEADRPFNAFELSRRWRAAMPELPGVRQIQIQDDVLNQGDEGNLGYRLFGSDIEQLNQAGLALIAEMAKIPGLYDLSSTIDASAREFNLKLTPLGQQLGLTPTQLAQQVGAGFFGVEAQRMIRDGDEVSVMVRYPRADREQSGALAYSRIQLADGSYVMLGDVATMQEVPGVSRINREAGFRTVRVSASVDQSQTTSSQAMALIKKDILPTILQRFPTVRTELGGQVEAQQRQQDQMQILMVVGLMAVYILLAVPLKSYSQPLIVMSVIPFSLVGACWAHYLLGYDLSLFSIFGIAAAAGVVINDSLVMTDYVNQARERGLALREAVVDAGVTRFRAILLTSLTTFFGLVPIMFETSLQAQFVIPMAISLSFAVMFATIVTLLLVPCIYLILEDIKRLLRRKKATTETI